MALQATAQATRPCRSKTRRSGAVNRRWRGNDGEWQEDTSFFTGTVWREQAESAAESLQKGARVIVTGRLEQRSWETEQGEKRSVVEIIADEIGPSLRWATAEVKRSERRGGGGAGGGGGGGDFGGGGGGGGGRPAPARVPDSPPDDTFDEEPF